nr:hypothetical protein BaRGS_034629 [Batillaria attramentaria]
MKRGSSASVIHGMDIGTVVDKNDYYVTTVCRASDVEWSSFLFIPFVDGSATLQKQLHNLFVTRCTTVDRKLHVVNVPNISREMQQGVTFVVLFICFSVG